MDNKEFREAFDGLTPPDELKERTRQAVRAESGGKKVKPPRQPWSFKRVTALVVSFALLAAVMVPVAAYFGFNSTGNEAEGLRGFSSIAEVKAYVSARKGVTYDNWFDSISFNGEARSDAAESPSSSSGGGTEHSTTNNQVEGVSEADVTHTDGSYIYTLSYYGLSVIDIRGGAFRQAAELKYDNFSPSEMFLMEDDGKLAVIGNYYTYNDFSYYYGKDTDYYCYWQSNSLSVRVYDIQSLLGGGDTPERELRFENCYLSGSRMIDGKMYLVMNAYSYYNPSDVWLPEYYDSATGDTALEASDIFATPDNGRSYNFTVIAGVDLKTGGNADVKAYFGSTGTLYASKAAFYITYQRYEKVTFFSYYRYEYIGLGVMRFGINGTGLDYKGMGRVEGRVVNQFAMDEYTYTDGIYAGKTYFRIATTAYDNSDSFITVFDGDMKQVGRLKGLGEENEQIYSVRFSGTEAVVVTYYRTDPLYVINLGDPEKPKIKSALKIPGVSDYLHFLKIKDGYVFAVGRGDGLSGIKVSLFDIRGEAPEEVAYYEVNANDYSYSEATYNHKAIMYFMPSAGDEEVFAFPVNVYGSTKTGNTYTYYNISSLYYYSVNAAGQMTQTVLGYHAEKYVSVYGSYDYVYYHYYRDQIRRSVIAGDYIYLVGNSGIERHSRLSLPGGQNDEGQILNFGGEYWTKY